MSSKLILGFMGFCLWVSPPALASRWVVQLPSLPENSWSSRVFNRLIQKAPHLKIVNVLSFGNRTFLSVELPDLHFPGLPAQGQAAYLSRLFHSDHVAPDYTIGLDNRELQGNPWYEDDRRPANPDFRPWHIQALRYDDLPPNAQGEGITVAILDFGIDTDHPALRNHLWKNSREIPDNGLDDDHNGYVDDVYGWNFTDNSPDLRPDRSHGTHCAGLIVAEKHEQSEARGLAPEAKIMSVKLLGLNNAPTLLSDAARAIQYAVDNGAQVLSNSWRVYRSWDQYLPTKENLTLLHAAIQYAQDKGAIFVATAGNEYQNNEGGDPIYPSGFTEFSHLISVAASNEEGELAEFSNYGPHVVHVAAPGEHILSTVNRGHWDYLSGTSMATPLVAAALARGLSAGMKPEQAITRLKAVATERDYWNQFVTSGEIDLVSFLDPSHEPWNGRHQ